jgi:hypothetical protein
MHILWGCLIAAIGLWMSISGRSKSRFVIFRVLVARARILWGDRGYGFFQVVGLLVFVVGVLVAVGVMG